jgi:GT2 family glycosyltransferase
MSAKATPRSDGKLAVVVLTYNRLHLLRQCVEKVLARATDTTREIVIWNNGSTDGTAEYLSALADPRIEVVNHDENIGLNAYARAIARTRAPYILELDDDMIDAPEAWDRALLEAFLRLPNMGFLQARLADDGHSPGADLFYRVHKDRYELKEVNGVRIWQGGPVGGGCTITPRDLYDRVGGFRTSKEVRFAGLDATYVKDIRALGYETAILDEVEVFHAGGPHYAPLIPEKVEHFRRRRRRVARKTTVKRALLAVPFVPALNARYSWFEPPPARS